MIKITMKLWIAVVGIVFALGLSIPSLPTLANPPNSTTQIKSEIVNLTGTIHKLALEGTCYQLATANGKKYELIGKFPKQDGVKVNVRGVLATDISTICQVGAPFQVKSYQIVK
jgi:hypothetical protein